ncbi:MAG: 3-deoxy-7-phosphoheptulonate synthase, partial [Planctomycetes bacterium]|nr:3-deoxy-7-phosphoheptulonate synthase [Planctomycetota bacterium]
ASLVPPMCAAAVAVGCDGLILEVHPDPSKAMSDGAQTITPDIFAKTMATCHKVADALGLKME